MVALRIIGIDPGTVHLGICVLTRSPAPPAGRDRRKVVTTLIEAIHTNPKWDKKARLVDLYRNVKSKLEILKIPGEGKVEVVLEKAYVGKFASAALALGESRGTIMAAAFDLGFSIVEYTPAEAKAAVGAKGNADKNTVARHVKLILPTGFLSRAFSRLDADDLTLDATDAAALAIRRAQDLKWM